MDNNQTFLIKMMTKKKQDMLSIKRANKKKRVVIIVHSLHEVFGK